MNPISRRLALAMGGAAAVGAPFVRSAALAAPPRADERADVIVVGAGLSGLNTALLLEEQGSKVIVLEGRDRPGGRLRTLDDVPGAPEAGGSGIGRGYARLIDRANTLGVKLTPARPRTELTAEGACIHVQGKTLLAAEWATSPLNPFAGKLRDSPPWAISFAALNPYNKLPSAASWRAPEMSPYDISVADFLTAEGWNEAQLRLAYGTNPSYGDSSHDLSVIMWWHIARNAQLMAGQGGGALAGAGGNQRIPEAMAKAVKSGVRYGQAVVGIRADNEGAEAVTADGSRYRGKALVCTLPTTALRLLRIDPPLVSAQQAAIERLAYNRVFQVHFAPTREYWKEDGLPASMWTDTLAGRFVALHYGANPDEVTSCLAFVNGYAADHLDRLDPKAAIAAVLADLAAARPSTRGALRPVKTVSWQRDPFSGGSYACWGPGQATTLANLVGNTAGRILFAGEHTAEVARGMEGAMESGERATLQALELI